MTVFVSRTLAFEFISLPELRQARETAQRHMGEGGLHAWRDGWMHGCMDAWMEAWMDAWIDVFGSLLELT